jgi:tetratricopeptide (TPR) repeat protein
MKLYKNGFIILLIISLAGTVLFYTVRDRAQVRLDEKINYSLELNREAEDLFVRGEYAGAKELLLESLSLNRLNPHTYTLLAFVELNLENYQQAYDYFVSALNMDVTSVEIIKNLSELLIKSGHYAEAEKYLRHGLKDYPQDEALQELLAEVKEAGQR